MTIPVTLDEALSPEWLSAALAARYPGVRVTAAEPGPVVARVSTNARVAVTVEGEGAARVPTNLCVKGYFGDEQRASGPAGEGEVLFYRDLADWTGVPTLSCVYAEIDPTSRAGVVVTEDVVEEGATFLDALSPYTADQAAASLELYARLHGRTWGSPKLHTPWLAPRLGNTLSGRGLPQIEYNYNGPIGAGVPVEVRDGERLLRIVKAIAERTPSLAPACLLHGDAHIGNICLAADGLPFLVDWQLVQRAPWYFDTAYHIGCAIPVEDRRRHEQELLTHYLKHLAGQGGPALEPADVETEVCIGLVYGLFLWSITMKVAPPVTTAMLDRLGGAVADHDALNVVERWLGE